VALTERGFKKTRRWGGENQKIFRFRGKRVIVLTTVIKKSRETPGLRIERWIVALIVKSRGAPQAAALPDWQKI
jgi:hypothetical protein